MQLLLERLLKGLLPLIETNPLSPEKGGLLCRCCEDYHTRGGEAAFPFVVLGKRIADDDMVDTGLRLADWLVRRQNHDGSWTESPGMWTGTTVFQLMALAGVMEAWGSNLSVERRERFGQAVHRAAGWVLENIRFRRATTNYVASGAAALALVSNTFPDRKWERGARRMANLAAGRVNRDGLVEGEGRGRRILRKIYFNPKGIDIGYGLEMTLASLSLYSAITGDRKIATVLDRGLDAHLYFIYPDGSLDNSLGSRGYKWTIYGSKTAHGSQMAWAFAAPRNNAMAAAQRLCTRFLERFLFDGLVSNGPNQREVGGRPCIYPSVVRSSNLAFAVSYFLPPDKTDGTLPCHREQWIKRWPSLNSVLIRRAPWMGTVSGYKESTVFSTNDGNRVFRVPSGGAITYLYHDDWGPIQAATQLDYWNWEVLHLPPRPEGVVTLTPRIEASSDKSLIMSAGHGEVTIDTRERNECVEIAVRGKLSPREGSSACLVGSYVITYRFERRTLTKLYHIHLRERLDRLVLVEPVILATGSRLALLDTGLEIFNERGKLTLTSPHMKGTSWQWVNRRPPSICPLPALVAYSSSFLLLRPERGQHQLEVVFEIHRNL